VKKLDLTKLLANAELGIVDQAQLIDQHIIHTIHHHFFQQAWLDANQHGSQTFPLHRGDPRRKQATRLSQGQPSNEDLGKIPSS
jgi:hypothetical protein